MIVIPEYELIVFLIVVSIFVLYDFARNVNELFKMKFRTVMKRENAFDKADVTGSLVESDFSRGYRRERRDSLFDPAGILSYEHISIFTRRDSSFSRRIRVSCSPDHSMASSSFIDAGGVFIKSFVDRLYRFSKTANFILVFKMAILSSFCSASRAEMINGFRGALSLDFKTT